MVFFKYRSAEKRHNFHFVCAFIITQSQFHVVYNTSLIGFSYSSLKNIQKPTKKEIKLTISNG